MPTKWTYNKQLGSPDGRSMRGMWFPARSQNEIRKLVTTINKSNGFVQAKVPPKKKDEDDDPEVVDEG